MAKPLRLPIWNINETNNIEPDTAHKNDGWLAPAGVPEKPAFQYFNDYMNLVYKWIREINTKGVIQYDTTTDYIALFSYCVGSDGELYQCIQNNGPGSSVQDPVSSPAYWNNLIQLFSSPPGQIVIWPVEIIPSGYIECNGSSLLINSYQNLYTVIGVRYGSGDDPPNTFNIPDTRGLFVRGWDHGAGIDIGASSKTFNGSVTIGQKTITLTTPGTQKLQNVEIGSEVDSAAFPTGTKVTFVRYRSSGDASDISSDLKTTHYATIIYTDKAALVSASGTGSLKSSRTDRGDGTTGDAVGTIELDQAGLHRHLVIHGYGINFPGSNYVTLSATGFGGGTVDDYWGESTLSPCGGETRGKNISFVYCIKI